jgi:Tfp pilus assembly PilM family ATPase
LPDINKDINSTEKLLNIIRGKDEESFGASEKQKVSLSANKYIKNINTTSSKRFFNKKRYTIGVDIGREFICLVKTAQNSDNKPVLVDRKIIKHSFPLSADSPELKTLLKSSIVDFCGVVADCNIWTKISTSEVNVYFLNIPRAPKKQIEKVIFWTAKKEGLIDEEKHYFDFEIRGEIIEQGNPKYSVMVYTALKTEVEKIKSLFSDIGINLTGITTVPFAVQNIFRSKWMPATEEIYASLFIGNNFSRIDVYNKENLVMTRGIKTGSSSSMAEAIVSSVLEKTGSLKLKHDEARKILFSIGSDTGKNKEKDAGYDFKKEEILEMISSVWERLARQVDLTLKTSSIGYQKVEKIYILSSVNLGKSFLDYMSDQLGTKTEFFEPFGKQKLGASTEPLSVSEEVLLSPALGFSLSDNRRTPNTIFTFQEKNKEINSKLIDRFVFSSFLTALIICLVTLVYQGSKLNTLKKNKISLDKELALYSPFLSMDKVLNAANEIKMHRKIAHQYAQKYLGLAAIGEISDLTPQNIRLISFKMGVVNKVAEGSAAPKTDADKTPKETTDDVAIEGIIIGKKDLLDSNLTQYVVKLENSPMFSKVSVRKKELVTFNKNEVIHFILSAKTGKS